MSEFSVGLLLDSLSETTPPDFLLTRGTSVYMLPVFDYCNGLLHVYTHPHEYHTYSGFYTPPPATRPSPCATHAAAGRLTTCRLAASHTHDLQPTRSSHSNNHIAQRSQAART